MAGRLKGVVLIALSEMHSVIGNHHIESYPVTLNLHLFNLCLSAYHMMFNCCGFIVV